MIRLLSLFLIALFINAHAGVLRVSGIPSRRVVVVQVQAITNDVSAKLPPPVSPGADGKRQPAASEAGKIIETQKPEAAPVIAGTEEDRKLKIKAERERLNENAVRWQRERAAAGSAIAMRSLGMRYMTGDGVERDPERGMDLLRKAAAGGDSAAKKELAKIESAKKE